ncbi:F0F1 ATP synthase subunit I [Modicisalibacter xianhensis]|uniref:ATP synthase protein I n=1 Tax=Modicisalibacter xianhensis TaxID=442341 RepID=A0A1I3B6D9_9GAMM|nr:F0F1 ATP synthase subunit I [Halomonas xianhensis]TDX28798.1 ATP synthase protein I [Halomonas xianhensis]SFH57848.1 ATP synthase protein I [Halomonas xianhensis]
MHNPVPAQLKRPQFKRLLVAQGITVTLMVILGAALSGGSAAISALTGGLVCLLPNAYFAWRAFRYQGARFARDIVKSFYRAEAGKFGLTAALFTLVFITVPPSNPAFFFGAYVATLFTQWLGPWLLRRPSHT